MSDPVNIIPRVVLGAPRKKSGLGTFAQVILAAFTGNAHYPNPNPALSILIAAIALFFSTQTTAKTRAAGAASAHHDAYLALLRVLNHLRDFVQATIESSPSAGMISVIESAGMRIPKARTSSKPQLAVQDGLTTMVTLVAKAVAKSAVYFWEYSLDQKTWTSAAESLKATTEITGLTPGLVYYFRFRCLTRKGKTDYSQVVSHPVK
jgi:hypothetical protein